MAENYYYVHSGSLRIQLSNYLEPSNQETVSISLPSKRAYLSNQFKKQLASRGLHYHRVSSINGNDVKGTKLFKLDPVVSKLFMEKTPPMDQKF